MVRLRSFFFALSLVFLAALPGLAADQPQGQRVFTSGHSFHMMIIGPLAEMARSAGIKDHKQAGSQGLGGSRTLQIWNLPNDKTKPALKAGTVDVLTLSPHVKLPDEGIDNYTALLLEHNDRGRVLVQASWYPYDLPEKNNRNFKNADRDKLTIEELRKGYKAFYTGMSDQVKALNEKHRKKCVFLVPVGHAVLSLREKVLAGKVPGFTKQSELFTDSIGHARPPVAILNAYCHFIVIYRKNPVGLEVPSSLKAGRTPEDADKLNRLLQEIAWETVTHEPLSGVTAPRP